MARKAGQSAQTYFSPLTPPTGKIRRARETKCKVRTLPGTVNGFSTITLTSDALLSLRRSTVLRGFSGFARGVALRCSKFHGPFSFRLLVCVFRPFTVRLAFVLRPFSVCSPSVLRPFTVQRKRNANGTETFFDAYCTCTIACTTLQSMHEVCYTDVASVIKCQ